MRVTRDAAPPLPANLSAAGRVLFCQSGIRNQRSLRLRGASDLREPRARRSVRTVGPSERSILRDDTPICFGLTSVVLSNLLSFWSVDL